MSDWKKRLEEAKYKVLELGCGWYPKPGFTVCVDKTDNERKEEEFRTDIVRDFAKRGIPFTDDTFDEVRMYDVIEHIEMWEDFVFTMNEVWRVLKNGGLFMFSTTNGFDNTFSHVTHFRMITGGNMLPYFQKSDSPEYIWMRKTEGIIADFKMDFSEGADSSILVGKFYAKK